MQAGAGLGLSPDGGRDSGGGLGSLVQKTVLDCQGATLSTKTRDGRRQQVGGTAGRAGMMTVEDRSVRREKYRTNLDIHKTALQGRVG